MAKIDWTKARMEYVADETTSYHSLSKKYGVNEGVFGKRAVKEKWTSLREERIKKDKENLPERVSQRITETNLRHFDIGGVLVAQGLKAIQAGKTPNNFQDARLALETGTNLQRKSLNLDNVVIPLAIQINFKGVQQKDIDSWT